MRHPSIGKRILRHLRLTGRSLRQGTQSPPFLVLFVNSICNLTCDHCFYWRNLNQRDDLSLDELQALSEDLGPIENLNLSGGEPFIRKDIDQLVKLFVKNNGVKQVYVPTNGYFTDRTEVALKSILADPDLDLFVCEFSLDGMPDYHNKFRGNPQSFEKAMETYAMCVELQKKDPRLRIHSISTVTNQNVDQIHRLTDYLLQHCPAMDHHNIAIIRGDRKDPALLSPSIADYNALYQYVATRWADREKDRFGSIVEPMLQWAKIKSLEEERQVVACTAGRMTGVVYANGDVGVCELHEPIGNLRNAKFSEIWNSEEANKLRHRVACKECWCTTEVFMWPSIVFQPNALAKSMVGAKVWKTPATPIEPLEPKKVPAT